MDQGRQGRDQVDTAVVQNVRGQRRAAPASCARLQSWQLSPHACNTGADQRLVADELEGKADQDRREGGEPRTLRRLPNGGGRHPTTHVPGDSAADRGTTAATNTRASMKRLIVTRSSAIDRRNASRCQGKQPDQADRLPSGRVEWWQQSAPRAGLVGRPEKRKYSRRFGVHLGNVGSGEDLITGGASGHAKRMLWLPMMKILSVLNSVAMARTVRSRSSKVRTGRDLDIKLPLGGCLGCLRLRGARREPQF